MKILDCSIRAVQHRLIDAKKDYPWPADMDKEGNDVDQSGVLPGSFAVTRKRKSVGSITKTTPGKTKEAKKEPEAKADANKEASS